MLRSVLIFAISAMFLGLGLGRFAFSPLIPELVETGRLDVSAAQAIGAANLIGYFIGAILARPGLRYVDERRLCIAGAGLILFSYVMFPIPFGVAWFWLARFLAGVGGAVLMVVGTAAAGRQLTALGRQSLQPLLFVGIGLGALFAAIGLPPLLSYGLTASIGGLMALSALGVVALWTSRHFLRREKGQPCRGAVTPQVSGVNGGIVLIILAYGCDALGFVMHTVYLPDMLRREYAYSEAQVGLVWAFFGIGACFGPAFVLLLLRRLSVMTALWTGLAIKAAAVALVTVSSDPLSAALSLFLVGMLTPGSVILTSAALSSAAPSENYLGLWAAATALFALGQMVSGIVIAAISGTGYAMALGLSVAVMTLGAILAFAARHRVGRGAG